MLKYSSAIPLGSSREEHYTVSKTEPFGLNKRTRRIKAGQIVAKPDGTMDSWMHDRKRKHS